MQPGNTGLMHPGRAFSPSVVSSFRIANICRPLCLGNSRFPHRQDQFNAIVTSATKATVTSPWKSCCMAEIFWFPCTLICWWDVIAVILLGSFSVQDMRPWQLALGHHQDFKPNKSKGVFFLVRTVPGEEELMLYIFLLFRNLSVFSNAMGNDHVLLQAVICNFGRSPPTRKCSLLTEYIEVAFYLSTCTEGALWEGSMEGQLLCSSETMKVHWYLCICTW